MSASSNGILLPRRGPSPVEAHRRRVETRVLASRVVVVLAVLGLVSAVAHGLRRVFSPVADLVPGLTEATARPTLLLVSIALLITARGLRKGHRLSWVLALGVLALSAVLHLLKGVDVFETLVLLAALVWLASRWSAFPVLPTRRAVRRAAWVTGLSTAGLAGAVALVATLVPEHSGRARAEELGSIVHPVSFALTLVFVVTMLWALTSPRDAVRLSPADHVKEREHARHVVERHGGGTLDYFALRDDKDWFFVADSVVAFSVRGGVCLVSPDPIGPADERELVWAEFLSMASSNGWSVAVVAASADWLPVYEASGLHVVYFGDEAVVDCPTFTLAGSAHKSLRQAVNRVERAGYTTTFHDPATLDADLRAAISEMAEESRRGEDERGFSMTLSRLFDPADTGLMLSVTRSAEGRVDAFCQWVPAAAVDGWSLDVMRRRLDTDDIPNGLVDTTIVHTVAELVRRGERGLGLNFAVMREVLESDDSASRLDQVTRPLLQRLSRGTQMETLGKFNDKFEPTWVPRYVVLDSAELIATQAVVLAGAEGVTEIPVIGRFLGAVGTAR